MVFGWTFTINPQTPKDLYLLHLVTQTIVNEKYELLQKAGKFGKLKIKFIKKQLPGLTNKTKSTESPLSTTKRLTKI